MTISFEKEDKELVLCYAPTVGTEDIIERLNNGEDYLIKHTFCVNRSLLRETREDDFSDTLRFCIGSIGKSYTQIDSEIIGTTHQFFFSNDIKLKAEMFVAYRNISILRKIDKIITSDFYIGGNWEEICGLPFDAYRELLNSFPKTAELDKYVDARIAIQIKEFFPECDKYEEIFNRFIQRKEHKRMATAGSKANLEIECAQFTEALFELRTMLDHCSEMSESDWQIRVQSILQLLYPKYILSTREVVFTGVDGYDKRPDFVLVDTNGFVDILEIKKPNVQILTKQASYRNNYVPVRELSGAIQQIEKYIFCLTTERSKKEVIKKLSSLLHNSIPIEIVNPQGMLIAGRSNGFNAQQKRDYELIKRQYKHIADIMTYDDLISRLENVVSSLERRLAQWKE